MKLGVVGVGVVGGAIASYFKKHGHELVLDDPPRGITGDCRECAAIFVCVPVETVRDKRGRWVQDLTTLKAVLRKYQAFPGPIFIRSTVLPKTCDNLGKFFRMKLYAMPEFLTERAADATFAEQDLVVGSPASVDDHLLVELLDSAFPDKEISYVKNVEAELAKYAHNCMGAIKVNFFNLVYALAKRYRAEYSRVLDGVLLSGYINREHTQVPGPDGKLGFGGKCFPKDLHAFVGELERLGYQSGSLSLVAFENLLARTGRGLDFKAPKIVLPDLGPVEGEAPSGGASHPNDASKSGL